MKMKMKMPLRTLALPGLLIASLLYPLSTSFGQGTAFTYSGRLNNGGAPANGSYDLRFTVYDSDVGAGIVAGPLSITPVTVANGLFSVQVDFGAGVFTGPARWLEIGVRPVGVGDYTTLAPRQELTSSPYAIRAASAGTAADVSAGSVVKSLNTLKDAVTLAAGDNVTITPNGNTLTLAATGAGGSGIWSLSGASTYYSGGNVGIGTSMPAASLEVDAQDAVHLLGDKPFLTFLDTTAGNARGVIRTVNGSVHLYTESYMNGANPLAFLALNNSGNVGIGEGNPVGKLEVVAQDALHLRGNQPFLTFQDSTAGNARGIIRSVNGSVNLFTESYVNGANPLALLSLNNSGNVGIGEGNPSAKLEVVAQDALHLRGDKPFLTFQDSSAGNARGVIRSVNGAVNLFTESYMSGANPLAYLTLNNNGNVGIGTANPQAALDVNGTTQTKVLTITGGADLAEPFELSGAEASKGAVVVIDEEHPGRLKLSAKPYDTRVAGIVSGANGINPGISLRQRDALEAGQNVALSGRVYVQADATPGAIKPGDLLTTSNTPGHAMKVTDHAKAQGAILGKAMSSLSEGRGMVLVLVTLQ